MGRVPEPETVDHGGSLSVGKREMLERLRSLVDAKKNGSVTTKDYYIKFTSVNADRNKQSGRCNRRRKQRRSQETPLELEILVEVEKTFKAVEDGFLNEGGYYFELTTPYFQYTSGYYPLHHKDGYAWWLFWDYMEVWVPLLSCLLLIKELAASVHRSNSRKKIHGMIVLCIICSHANMTEASPVHETDHPLTLTAGVDGTIPFECSNDHRSDAPKYYTVKFEEKERPFYVDGNLDPEGLMSPDQVNRFKVNYDEDDSVMSIEIQIASVSLEDQGTYIVMVIITGETPEPRLMKKVVIIYIPPGPAACFIQPGKTKGSFLELHCNSKRGNGNGTLACFQNGAKLPYRGAGGQTVYRRAFYLLKRDVLTSCCAHDIKYIDTITEAGCKQYTWPRNHVTDNPLPTKKVPSEVFPVSRPNFSNDDDKSPPENFLTTVYSGSAKSYQIWQKAMLSLMPFVAYACSI